MYYLRGYRMTWVACRSITLHCTSGGSTFSGNNATQPSDIGLYCPVSLCICFVYDENGIWYLLKMKHLEDKSPLSQALLFPACVLTSWNGVLAENLTCPQLLKKFPAFYGTRRFVAAFTRARHQFLS
jgi:hypothetical protein